MQKPRKDSATLTEVRTPVITSRGAMQSCGSRRRGKVRGVSGQVWIAWQAVLERIVGRGVTRLFSTLPLIETLEDKANRLEDSSKTSCVSFPAGEARD